MNLLPLRPLRAPGLPAAPVPGSFKQAPADFEVEELPSYLPAGEGEHTLAFVEKTGMTTLNAIDRLASALGVSAREVGYAGMKDAQAVTRQWLSLPGVDPARVLSLELDGIRCLEAGRHRNKLKIGHLAGNRFRIVVRGPGAEHLDAIRANLAWLGEHGVPNWFGEQRFGSGGRNLEKGLRILFGDRRRAGRGVPKRIVRLMVSAVQSEVFNHVLAERVDDFGEAIAGDVAWQHRNGACFVVGDDDVADVAARCASFELSPSGPLPGPDCLAAAGDQGELEAAVLEALELEIDLFERAPGGGTRGARRPLRVCLQDPGAELVDGGIELRFALERGAYATSVLRELLADPPWFDDVPREPDSESGPAAADGAAAEEGEITPPPE